MVENISRSISTKVWDRVGIKLASPGSAVGLATDCATGLGVVQLVEVKDSAQLDRVVDVLNSNLVCC